MPTRRQLIQKIELNSDASSVTFSDIPQNYTDLKLEVTARGSTDFSSQISTDFYIEFNGSTSGYSRRSIYADFPSTAGSTSGSNIRGQINLPISTSGTFASNKAYIPNYNSSQNKTISLLSISETNSATGPRIENVAGLWSSSSAISSIKFTPYTGSFVANSTFYLYGITHVPIIRGGEVSIANGFKIHTFKSTASLQVVEGGKVEYLIVGGGGGGGEFRGGGGGAGGFLNNHSSLSAGFHTITIGAGGSGGASPTNGANSVFQSLTAYGGGYGGDITTNGASGASGGGGGGGSSTSGGASSYSGQGNAGGSGTGADPADGGGGGGGAGGVGQSGTGSKGGDGGPGATSSITGTLIHYAGGGGGAMDSGSTIGSGGIGGGGDSGIQTGAGLGSEGETGGTNTGGGGGGGGGLGGSGGSGIVIIRYPYDGN